MGGLARIRSGIALVKSWPSPFAEVVQLKSKLGSGLLLLDHGLGPELQPLGPVERLFLNQGGRNTSTIDHLEAGG